MKLKDQIAYLKDNPKGYWFKRKIYGWGWVPVKWQGWVIILVFILLLIGSALSITKNEEPTNRELTLFFIKEAVLVTLLITICYKKGEKPRWQWGIKEKNNA